MTIIKAAQYMVLSVNDAFGPGQTPDDGVRGNITRLLQATPAEIISATVGMGNTWQNDGKHLSLGSVKLLRDTDLEWPPAGVPQEHRNNSSVQQERFV